MPPPHGSRVRWWMLTLLFLATTINYLDRVVFSSLIPVIRTDLGLDDQSYGYVISAFQYAYTVGFLFAGGFIDRFGTKMGYAVAVAWWSVAAMLHGLTQSALGLGFWRAMLGLGEAGNFPAAVKSVAEWFPQKDRAFATGVFNAGTNVASMIGPRIFAAMVVPLGWRACFFVTGALGLVWLAVWLWSYRLPRQHPGVSREELAYIESDTEEADAGPAMRWREALAYRPTWGFAGAKFLTDPVWWFYLYWLTPYFTDVWKFSLAQIGWVLLIVYAMADVGSVMGGWLSGRMIRRGWPVARARWVCLALFAACFPVSALAVLSPNPWVAALLVSVATAAHQGWSANLYTTASDIFPKRAVGSVVGIGGCAGGLGGAIFTGLTTGYVVKHFGYAPVFVVVGIMHPLALGVVTWLMGRMERVGERPAVRVG